MWITTKHPSIRFERYADDIIVHCHTQKEAEEINNFRIHRWSSGTIEEIADTLYSKLQGWINYYGKFRKWLFLNVFRRLTLRLMQWVKNKYKLTSVKESYQWLRDYQKVHPNLFAHWRYGFKQ